jgi:hypothetical protein
MSNDYFKPSNGEQSTSNYVINIQPGVKEIQFARMAIDFFTDKEIC